MKALEIEKSTVFSTDGGETWLVALAKPRDGNNDDLTVLAAPVDSPSLGSASKITLGAYDHVWEPSPEDLSSGTAHFRVKESAFRRGQMATYHHPLFGPGGVLIEGPSKRPGYIIVRTTYERFEVPRSSLTIEGKRTVTIGELKKLLGEAVLAEDDAAASTPEYENGDSLDAQVDRYLSDYEASSRTAKHEGRDFGRTIKRLLGEAGDDDDSGDDSLDLDTDKDAETEDTPAPEPKKPGPDAIDVEEFANNVARLIENYDTLLEVRSTVLRRSINFVSKNYDPSVSSAFEKTMRDKHGVVDGETKEDVDDDLYPAPPADRAGPGGAG